MSSTMAERTAYMLVRPTLPDPAELLDDIRSVFRSGRVTMGENVAALEEEHCERARVRHTVAVSCATSGLMLLLRALDLPRGSEVITPTFTFAATAHALLWNGLRPVFCDSEPESFTMDASVAESLITHRTSAIFPVCIFGVPGDLDAYQSLARRRRLALLYDSAQGLGSSYKGTLLGNFGAAEVFSMSPTKVVTALEGGLIATNDDDLAYQLRYMRDYGKAPDGEDMRWLGLSARMCEVNAIVGRWSMARTDEWAARRSEIMDRYTARLRGIPGVSFQRIPEHVTSTRNYFVALLDPTVSPLSRDELYQALKERGVQTKRYFFPVLHNQTLYRQIDPECRARLPVAERIAARSLALPMYSHMRLDEVDDICERITECMESVAGKH